MVVSDCSAPQTLTINVDDATGAFAFDFDVDFDCSLTSTDPPADGDCSLGGADVRLGSLVSDCALCGSTLDDGTLSVGIGCTSPITGGGSLLEIDFHGWANGTSAVTLSGCRIDEQDCAGTNDGMIQVSCAGHDADVDAHVALQGRAPAPDPSWSVPVRFAVAPAGGGPPVLRCTRTTDENGNFSLGALAPGDYVTCVKRPATLQNCVEATLASGSNAVNLGTLREGDTDDDNCVLLIDFSLLANTFGKCSADAGFDARADFNEDGCVLLLDFSLLASNFGSCGDQLPAAGGGAALEGHPW
jgi:hypothetical protein